MGWNDVVHNTIIIHDDDDDGLSWSSPTEIAPCVTVCMFLVGVGSDKRCCRDISSIGMSVSHLCSMLVSKAWFLFWVVGRGGQSVVMMMMMMMPMDVSLRTGTQLD